MSATGLTLDSLILISAGLLVVSILVVGFSDRLRLPAALISLGVGIVFGSDVLGVVVLGDFELVRNISIVGLIVILFEGGLTTKPSTLREAGLPGLALATVGVVVTAGVTALGVIAVFDFDPTTALLLGAVVSSTDAAVVFDLVKRAPLPRRLAGILATESGANDPVAIVLTLGILSTIDGETSGALDWLLFAGRELIGGLLVGLAVGALARWVLSVPLRSDGLYPIVAGGMAGLAYGLAAILGASGFLAVYVAGLVIGATVPRRRRTIRSFHASLADGADVGLFLLLGLLVFPAQLPGVAIPALVVTVVLVLAARPAAVLISLLPFRLSWREQVVISWAGLRGAIPIVLATFPATAGLAEGQAIFNVVLFVVVVSTILQSTTTVWLVRVLGLEAKVPAWQSVAETVPLDLPEVDLVELTVTSDMVLPGTTLAATPPPRGVLVVAVIRHGDSLIPTGRTVIEEGDRLVLSVDVRLVALTDVTAWARGEGAERSGQVEQGSDVLDQEHQEE